ncbi:MAG: hypothetical protein EOO40_12050 [Deltaproteobacteria bacterium]|nr:MAG: hypothetical protein EOO40_12050 [Deltaproteobacteria bacterium]
MADLWRRRAEALLGAAKPRNAFASLRKARDLTPTDAAAHERLYTTLLQHGADGQALTALREAYKKKPSSDVCEAYARLLERRDQAPRALEISVDWCLSGRHFAVHRDRDLVLCARLAAKTCDMGRFYQAWERVRHDAASETLLAFGDMALAAHEVGIAMSAFTRVSADDLEAKKKAYAQLARLHREAGNRGQEAMALTKLCVLEPRCAQAHRDRAVALERLGDCHKAARARALADALEGVASQGMTKKAESPAR